MKQYAGGSTCGHFLGRAEIITVPEETVPGSPADTGDPDKPRPG